jgi:hypothetical protein
MRRSLVALAVAGMSVVGLAGAASAARPVATFYEFQPSTWTSPPAGAQVNMVMYTGTTSEGVPWTRCINDYHGRGMSITGSGGSLREVCLDIQAIPGWW